MVVCARFFGFDETCLVHVNTATLNHSELIVLDEWQIADPALGWSKSHSDPPGSTSHRKGGDRLELLVWSSDLVAGKPPDPAAWYFGSSISCFVDMLTGAIPIYH